MSTEESACGDPFNPTAPGIKIVEAKPDELCWVGHIQRNFILFIRMSDLPTGYTTWQCIRTQRVSQGIMFMG